MQITSIRITKRDNTGTKLKATATIVIDNMIVINDIKVLERGGVLFLAMPSRTTKAGTFKDVVHPINQEVRTAFESLIIGAYQRTSGAGFSIAELILKENSCRSLLEQTCEMFTFGRTTSSERLHSFVNRQSDSNQADDLQENIDLIKWLEG